jgi:hypothetical protein
MHRVERKAPKYSTGEISTKSEIENKKIKK